MIRRVLPAALAVVLVAVLAGCGERKEPSGGAGAGERVELMLDYVPNADHAGIYTALETGEFEAAGLDVRARTPSDPAAPLKLLAAGRADLAISYEPELLLARAKGAKLVSIGALVQTPLTSIVSLGSRGIDKPEQLDGKKIGTAGIPYQDAYLKTILQRAGAGDVRSINVGFNLVPALVSKRVDAVLGAFWNVEGVELERRGRDPHILRVDKIGVPTYNELIIVAREQDARSRGALLRRFMRALGRGHDRLREHTGLGVEALVKADRNLKAGLLRAQIRATLPVFFPRSAKRPFGFQNPVDWRRYAKWMFDNELLSSRQNADRAFTNEFLPGEGI
ncbi:MAG: ABC transporter substrate-binding protein [Solirubrobacteraceae bacterium]